MSIAEISYNFFFRYSLKDVIADHIMNKVVKASRIKRLKRISVCRQCEYLIKPLGGIQQCSKCGCFIVKKAEYYKSTCPIGKWV